MKDIVDIFCKKIKEKFLSVWQIIEKYIQNWKDVIKCLQSKKNKEE